MEEDVREVAWFNSFRPFFFSAKKLQSKFDRSTFHTTNRISPGKLLACSSITVAHDGTRGSRGLYLNDNLVPAPASRRLTDVF